ncbi:DUF2840 domain-containing protein [Pelagibius sp.]|uniref:DUF2840 domain-containing protein n=1 Tax=Pelagibius sp. TaxID=1931238 RepID=UPI003B50A100
MSEPFTRVEIAFYPEHLNNWLRFGMSDEQHDLDRRRSLALFKPGRVFGYVRWRANEYGTQEWRFSVVRTAGPSVLSSRIKGVQPGGEVLLLAIGNAKVKRALLQIDVLETKGFEPADVSIVYYRHVHNRIATRRPIRAYSEAQHSAHLAGRRVLS